MPEPTSCAGCCVRTGTYCDRCDLLVGLPGLHVIKVVDGADRFTVTVESPPAPAGCPVCGVIATSGGRCRGTTSRVGWCTTSRVGLGRVIMSWVHLRRRG